MIFSIIYYEIHIINIKKEGKDMAWESMKFKGKSVWVEVEEGNSQSPVIKSGMISLRYANDENAKIYRGSAHNLDDYSAPKQESTKKIKKTTRFGSAKTRTEAQTKKAHQFAQQLLEKFSEDAYIVFTDGACRGNPGPSGVGMVLKMPDGTVETKSRYLGEATNNIAELTAIGDAIEMLEEKLGEDWQQIPVHIMTDSQYSLGILTKNWKVKANRPLVMGLRSQLKKHPTIKIHWVAGHAGIDENEMADQLATKEVEAHA
jgi:ribonuclease HI